MAKTVIEMQHITKRFGAFTANDDISLTLQQGEILALLGENGAGKSTLMGVLTGQLKPTAGQLLVNGQAVTLNGPRHAKALGIGMVHQHFMLIPAFTVLENIILGDEPTKQGRIDYATARQKVTALVDKYQLALDLDRKIADISVGMQQRVEIIKALYREATTLIFDEPTAALTPNEIQALLAIFEKLKAEGKSLIFITHKLKEIKQVADRCVVIRAGRVIDTVLVVQTDPTKLAEMMVGRPQQAPTPKMANQGAVMLSVEHVAARVAKRTVLDDLGLTVHAGEIVGIAGIDGNGQSELIQVLTGQLKPQSGKIELAGQSLLKRTPRQISEQGLGCIPEDRQNIGLILPLSIAENLALKDYYHQPYSHLGWLNYRVINQTAQKLIKRFDIRTQSEQTLAGELSGGNQQKVVVAREIAKQPKVLIAANPTRGVDVGAIEYIHQSLIEQRNQGCGILFVSFELDEILKLADRVLVMHAGQIVGEVDPQTTTSQTLGLLMAGQQPVGGRDE
ncbi:heme ABC transporter ATP-binding protein [Latilactobacillus curvatus]|uniref:Heme ABC transporter ATP-binding protein n=1 Tax=Latilactobacillus curvatus TaxID=28038 RepID=A0ABN6GIY5_LATCU|nr:ABC transporter ATP-binding protein [Latilactobacillus curvatus]BCX30402.1 heme ABC transporter ATP-binding protein [Latilactobacillus curvatus]